MKRSGTEQAAGPEADWLVDGGATGEMIRALDWSATPLGARATWPPSLRTVVNLVLANSFPMAILWGSELIIIYNDAYRIIAGERHPAAMGRPTREVWPEAWEFNKPIFEKVMSRGETEHLEDQLFRIVRRGSLENAYFTLSYSPIYGETGRIGGSLVTLLQSEANFRTLFENSLDAMFLTTPDGQILDANPAACALFGMSEAEFIRVGRAGVSDPDDSRLMAGLKERQRTGRFRGELRFVRKDGTKFPAEVESVILPGNPPRSFVILRDISQRKRAEEALRESEERYRCLNDVCPDAIFVNREGKLVLINQAGLKLFGATTAAQMLGRSPYDFTHPDYHAAVRERLHRVLALGELLPPVEQQIIRLDGTLCTVEVIAAPVVFDGVVSVQAVLRDITERKRAEEALQQSRELVHAAMDSLGGHICVLDAKGIIIAVNQAWRNFAAANPPVDGNVAEGANYLAVCDAAQGDDAQVARTFAAGIRAVVTGQRAEVALEYPCHSPDQRRWFIGRVTPFVGGSAGAVVVAHENISPRKEAEETLRRTEELLRQSQKLEAVGQLAGGVAHDFRNQLTIIKGFVELLQCSEAWSPDSITMFQEVHKAVDRSSTLIARLLAFSRKQVLAPKVADINDEVTELAKILPKMLGEDTHVAIVLSPLPCPALLDVGQLQEALVNLANNARDAMPHGGTITIATARVAAGDPILQDHLDMPAQECVAIHVHDTGIGMNEDTRLRVFEPFFTTKPVGQGTGLGLAMVYGFIKQSG
ncbi:MAG: PAS domain S-box protein, partial [Phycisphaerae bacterium]